MIINHPTMGVVHLNVSDPTTYVIQANGKRYTFEWHHYCGPVNLNKNGDPSASQPIAFLHAASQWNKQGRKIEDGLCVWFHEPEHIVEHMGGRHYKFIGPKEPRRGE